MALPKLESPTYMMEIPSLKREVEFRPFTVKEQKTLLFAKESGDEAEMLRATKNLISTCVLDDIDASSLTLFDFEYIFLNIRAKSAGETSDVQIKCDNCGSYTPVSIDISQAKVVGNTDIADNKIELTDEVGLVMRYPRFEDITSIMSNKGGTDIDTTFSILVQCIDSIYDKEKVYPAEDHTQAELQEFLENIPGSGFQKVNAFFSSVPSVEVEVDFKCAECGQENSEKLRGLKSFF